MPFSIANGVCVKIMGPRAVDVAPFEECLPGNMQSSGFGLKNQKGTRRNVTVIVTFLSL